MHEYHLLKDLLQKIDQVTLEQSLKKIHSVKIWLGALSHISPEHLKEHFQNESKGHACQGATLLIECSNQIDHEDANEIRLLSLDAE